MLCPLFVFLLHVCITQILDLMRSCPGTDSIVHCFLGNWSLPPEHQTEKLTNPKILEIAAQILTYGGKLIHCISKFWWTSLCRWWEVSIFLDRGDSQIQVQLQIEYLINKFKTQVWSTSFYQRTTNGCKLYASMVKNMTKWIMYEITKFLVKGD